jgi:hypothetical protein
VSAKPRSTAYADEQQAQLLHCLRAAGGRPVSFEELRERGIENPAVLCYELEMIGVPIARVNRYVAPGRPVPVGVRIEESAESEPVKPSGPSWQAILSAAPGVRRHASEALGLARAQLDSALSRGSKLAGAAKPIAADAIRSIAAKAAKPIAAKAAKPIAAKAAKPIAAKAAKPIAAHATKSIAAAANRHRGLIAGIALLAAAAVAIPLALGGQSARPANARAAGAGTHHAPGGAARQPGSHQAFSPEHVATPATPSGEPSQLEAEGHRLLGEERYGPAIADLRAAVVGSDESASRCLEPESEACLTYAYALFDLGRALLLEGDRADAVTVLSERLRIDNQRGAVQEELKRASEGGSSTATAGGGSTAAEGGGSTTTAPGRSAGPGSQ